jgi:hypothetical protein
MSEESTETAETTETTTTDETSTTTDVTEPSGTDKPSESNDTTEPTSKESVDHWLKELGLEDISEDDLKGIEEEEANEEPEPKEKETAEEKKTEPLPPKAEAPPKGFVPTKAVQEAREENRYLKEQIKSLQEKVDALAQSRETKAENEDAVEDESFKVLSKFELIELAEESPQEAIAYMLELQNYKERQVEKQQSEKQKAEAHEQAKALFKESADLMEQAVPGIFDEKSDTQMKLVEFAESLGFTEDLFFLTNPETMIVLPGETTPRYLGKQAAGVLKFIAGLKDKVAVDSETIVKKLRGEIENEVLKKVKSSGKNFKSLNDITTSESDVPKAKRSLSEAELMKLSDKELHAYLSGND